MIETDIIFSINVHEKKNFLIKQLKNISEYVKLNYIIIINPNDYMYNELLNCEFIKSQKNIIINPDYLNKKYAHGSLTKGIYLNMYYASINYNFKYFIILSSRNLFYNQLNNLENINISCSRPLNTSIKYENLKKNSWHWPSFTKTELGNYVIKNNLLFSGSAHEGLTFNYDSCIKIINFLDNNNNIKENLFNWDKCVEEFALQTICVNFSGEYYYIGNGVQTSHNINNLPKDKYIYKTIRN